MRTISLILVAMLAGGCELLPLDGLLNEDTGVSDPADVEGEREEVDVMLPMNAETLAASYLNCLTGDRLSAMDLLIQQLEWAEAPTADVEATALAVLQNGYCQQLLSDVDADNPELRQELSKSLLDNGLDPRVPIGEQTEAEEHASIFKKIWDWIKDKLAPNGGGGGDDNSKHVTVDTQGGDVNAPIIIICAPTANPADPEPFFPDPPPRP